MIPQKESLQPIYLPPSGTPRKSFQKNHYYNGDTAKFVYPILCQILARQQDAYITCRQTGLSVNSLLIKFNCGWNYILDNPHDFFVGMPTDQVEFNRRQLATLKELCTVSKVPTNSGREPGVIVRYKNNSIQPDKAVKLEAKLGKAKVLWRETLASWLRGELSQEIPLEIKAELSPDEVLELLKIQEKLAKKFKMVVTNARIWIEKLKQRES